MPDPSRTQTPDPVTRGNDSLARARRDTALSQQQQRQPSEQARGQAGQSWADRRLCQALEGITLTDAQQVQIDSIRVRYASVLSAVVSDSGITVEQRAALDAQDAQVRAQLTPEQQAIFDRNVARLNANIISTRRER